MSHINIHPGGCTKSKPLKLLKNNSSPNTVMLQLLVCNLLLVCNIRGWFDFLLKKSETINPKCLTFSKLQRNYI